MNGPTFFSSRWCERPAHVREASGLPAGFRAAGVACGLKGGDALDLGLIVADGDTISAARFCDSGALAAPVLLCRERCDLHSLRAVIANSGNANAATGDAGLDEAARVQQAAAAAIGVEPAQVAVASTGVIGVPLEGERVSAALPEAVAALRTDGDVDFAHAIRTTDVLDKHVSLRVTLPSGEVALSAQCKGAGMISPRFATMLCFVQTDAALEPRAADVLLGVCAERSFDRISVDGQLSTNDTVILMAGGASGVRVVPASEDELLFGQALDALLRQLALAIVADGEGAKRIGRVVVRGGEEGAVNRVARAVADSPLVKTALFGGDPNWGRIAQAVGAAMTGTAPLDFDISIEGIGVCEHGAAVSYDADALADAVQRAEVFYEVALPGSGAETELFFSDLSYSYVKINAEYTT